MEQREIKLPIVTEESVRNVMSEVWKNCTKPLDMNLEIRVASIPYFTHYLDATGMVKPYQKDNNMLVSNLYGIQVRENKYMPIDVAVMIDSKGEIIQIFNINPKEMKV